MRDKMRWSGGRVRVERGFRCKRKADDQGGVRKGFRDGCTGKQLSWTARRTCEQPEWRLSVYADVNGTQGDIAGRRWDFMHQGKEIGHGL